MIAIRSFFLCLLLIMPLPSLAGDVIGTVIGLSGGVSIRDDKAQRFATSLGMQVETGQMVRQEMGRRSKSGWRISPFSGLPPTPLSSLMIFCFRVMTSGA